MNDLHHEISELKHFIGDLKADRAAAKEKEQREAWTKYVSLTVVIVAVIAAIASQFAGKYSSRAQMSQAQASDQWAFYQAKAIKQHLDETALAQLIRLGATNDGESARMMTKLRADLARYDQEKADLKAKAEALEKTRDDAGRRGGRMGLAVSWFSVAIATASICMVTRKKTMWFVSMILAALAVAQMLAAWTGP